MTSVRDPFSDRIRHYAEILNPLFWDEAYNRVDRMFEWACTLVRVTGLKTIGWDSYLESIKMLEDLTQLRHLELPEDRFQHPDDTKMRLALLGYAYTVEMSGPYDLLANLLRLRLGKKYSIEPLAHLNSVRKFTANGKKVKRIRLATPTAKIDEIKRMAEAAGVPEVGEALGEIYDAKIRNAVFHADYAISNKMFVLFSDFYVSKKKGVATSVLNFDEIAEITREAYAFHSALIQLWRRQLKLFTDFRGKILPYDYHYKGVIEFTFEGDTLNGFRVYWPNGTIGICMHNSDGTSWAQNIRFEPDGSVNFFVGALASKPGSFSLCVEDGDDPVYAPLPGTDKRPHWPSDLRPYAI